MNASPAGELLIECTGSPSSGGQKGRPRTTRCVLLGYHRYLCGLLLGADAQGGWAGLGYNTEEQPLPVPGQFDALDRLTQAYTTTVGGTDPYSMTYAYDQIGNLTQVYTPTLTRYEYPCQTSHRVAAGQNHALSYWYDQNGNMTKRLVNGTTYTLTYDAENRLAGVVGSNSTSASFVYDGDGQRVKSTIGVYDTVYIGTWYEYAPAQPAINYYLFGGRRVAKYVLSMSPHLDYLYGDHLNSTTETTGPQSRSQDYYPYGAQRGASTLDTDYRYTGQLWEAEIGLYYYGARWYDPALGRFIQPDTIVPQPGNPQSLNRYSYCLNNPLKYTDPSGHNPAGVTMHMPGQSLFGALMIALEAINPLPFDPLVIPLGVGLIATDPLWQVYGPYLPEWINQWSEAGKAARRASDQGGNTAGPSGLGPNNPWRWGTNYRANYEQFYGLGRDASYEVHHIMPQRFGQIIAKTSKGRINVDDPRWLREVLKMEPRTGTPIHERLYTDVWEDWAHGLGRDPSSEEIIQFAKRLEEQYSLEGTLFYRAGAGLPGRVDWEALLKLLGG